MSGWLLRWIAETIQLRPLELWKFQLYTVEEFESEQEFTKCAVLAHNAFEFRIVKFSYVVNDMF